MLYFTDMSEFTKTNVICCNLTNNRLKFNKLNTIFDASW